MDSALSASESRAITVWRLARRTVVWLEGNACWIGAKLSKIGSSPLSSVGFKASSRRSLKCLCEEGAFLQAQLRRHRLRLTDGDRRRLAALARSQSSAADAGGDNAPPDAILRWHRASRWLPAGAIKCSRWMPLQHAKHSASRPRSSNSST